jgi:hypothetical protein
LPWCRSSPTWSSGRPCCTCRPRTSPRPRTRLSVHHSMADARRPGRV